MLEVSKYKAAHKAKFKFKFKFKALFIYKYRNWSKLQGKKILLKPIQINKSAATANKSLAHYRKLIIQLKVLSCNQASIWALEQTGSY